MAQIALLPDWQAFLDKMVESGRYGPTPGDVVMYALAFLQDHEVAQDARRAWLEAAIDEGLADIDAGRTYSVDEVFDEIRQKIENQREQRAAAE